jgi:hypothetical protein
VVNFFKSFDDIPHKSVRKLLLDAYDLEAQNTALLEAYFRSHYGVPVDAEFDLFGKREITGQYGSREAYANDHETRVPGTGYHVYILRPIGSYGSYTAPFALDRGNAEFVLATSIDVEIRNSDEQWALGGPSHSVYVYGLNGDPRNARAYYHNSGMSAISRDDFLPTVAAVKAAYEQSKLALWYSQHNRSG